MTHHCSIDLPQEWYSLKLVLPEAGPAQSQDDYPFHVFLYLLQESQAEFGTLMHFSRKQHFIVVTQTQQTHVLRLSPKNKEISRHIPRQAGYRSKKQSSTHLWLHVTLLAISVPQCYVTFMFQVFKFYLSALPSLSAVSSEYSLSVSLLALLPATLPHAGQPTNCKFKANLGKFGGEK
jgi:hypothetical protein